MANSCRLWKRRNLCVGDSRGIHEFIGKSSQPRTKHEADGRTQACLRQEKLRSSFGERESVSHTLYRLSSERASALRNLLFNGSECQAQNFFSNAANCSSNCHCTLARSLPSTNFLHAAEFLSAQAFMGRKLFGSDHKLSPGRKLCSRLILAISFKSM